MEDKEEAKAAVKRSGMRYGVENVFLYISDKKNEYHRIRVRGGDRWVDTIELQKLNAVDGADGDDIGMMRLDELGSSETRLNYRFFYWLFIGNENNIEGMNRDWPNNSIKKE